jgi:glycosyltransferase involved in cell wall biosynthesis
MKIDRNRVLTNIIPELLMRIPKAIPVLRHYVDAELYKSRVFDRWASRHIDGSDLVVAWAGFALDTFMQARRKGIKTVLERASTHCTFYREILEEEYNRLGMKRKVFNSQSENLWIREYLSADYISVPSGFAMKSFLAKGMPRSKLLVTPFGVDFTEFRRIAKDDKVFRVIFVGSGSIRKGLHYLLEAISGLRLRNFQTWIISAGISEDIKPYMARYRDCYRYLGSVSFYKLYRYYSQGSVFVLPSIEEGMALVLLQAMACGLPVICTPNTGGEDIIRDGVEGFIVPIRNPQAIREKILRLYEHREGHRGMAEAAFQRVHSDFSWQQYGQRMILNYQKILDGHFHAQ